MMWVIPKTDWKPSDYVNIKDWNRVENDTRYIAEFFGIVLQYKGWTYTDYPTPGELNRMKGNINTLLAQARLKINDANLQAFDYRQMIEIENCLVELYSKMKELELSLKRCGTVVAGQQIYLPIGVIWWQK